MNWLIPLAIALQLADGAQTCLALRNPNVHEVGNPLLLGRPSCSKVMMVKGLSSGTLLLPMPKKLKMGLAIYTASNGALGIGLSIKNVWSKP